MSDDQADQAVPAPSTRAELLDALTVERFTLPPQRHPTVAEVQARTAAEALQEMSRRAAREDELGAHRRRRAAATGDLDAGDQAAPVAVTRPCPGCPAAMPADAACCQDCYHAAPRDLPGRPRWRAAASSCRAAATPAALGNHDRIMADLVAWLRAHRRTRTLPRLHGADSAGQAAS